jgi:hypothetical protein
MWGVGGKGGILKENWMLRRVDEREEWMRGKSG